MSVLILNHSSLAAIPYDRMLAGEPGPFVVFSDAARMRWMNEDPADFADRYVIETFENYDLNDLVELRALQLDEKYHFNQIVTFWEFDLLRAARIRERLGLPGQSVRSATVYRDKVVMKDVASAAGIPVTPYRGITSAMDVIDFVAEHGLPVVVKPRNGGGSLGIRIVRTQADLEALLAAGLTPHMEAITDLMIEKYVDGLMYNVDGVVLNDKLVCVWPAQYFNDSLSFSRHQPLGSVLLAPDHPLRRRLQDLTRKVIASFPTPFAMTFHCEIFHTTDDQLLLCEIASRTGGARVGDMIRLGFGIDMNTAWQRNICGLPIEIPERLSDPESLPSEPLAWLAIPSQPGAIFAYPETVPFDWVTEPKYIVKPDEVLGEATINGDFIGTYVVHGESEQQLREERLPALAAWAYEHFITPDQQHAPARADSVAAH
jgi:biotin carboxylase